MQYDEEFKKNAVKLSYASQKTVKQVAEDLGIKEARLYLWRKKYTSEGEKSRYATLEDEVKALRLQQAEARIEADIQHFCYAKAAFGVRPSWRCPLKKATAYFANLSK